MKSRSSFTTCPSSPRWPPWPRPVATCSSCSRATRPKPAEAFSSACPENRLRLTARYFFLNNLTNLKAGRSHFVLDCAASVERPSKIPVWCSSTDVSSNHESHMSSLSLSLITKRLKVYKVKIVDKNNPTNAICEQVAQISTGI